MKGRAKPPATFADTMKLIEQTIALLKRTPRVSNKRDLRFIVDQMMTKIAGITPAQRKELEAKRRELDKALGLHEQGN